ncbi:MAG: single-stranded DNA-binding protein [Burkholderiales bacterium]|nr:single-stranded DNA-binding protein [Burkholderiales bacterium]
MKKIIITGNVGKDPELRADQNSTQFATFSVGVSVGTKQNPKTDWVEVSCNGKLAELAKNYIKKGMKLLIEGYPSASAYINRDNKPVASLRVYANVIEFLSKREDNAADDYSSHDPVYNLPEAGQSHASGNVSLISDDIPF